MADTPVVCVLGPRQSGKTTLVRQMFPERPFVSMDILTDLQVASMDPDGFVARFPDSVTIDEIQRAPELLPAIKHAVDQDRRPGQFLLTGSANLLLARSVTESLAGRMEIVELQPLTEAEKSRNSGNFVRDLLNGNLKPRIQAEKPVIESTLADRLVAGGYPEPLTRTPRRTRRWHREYVRSIIERDVPDVARVNDAHELARLLELLALRTGQLLNISNLAMDLGMHRNTAERYIAILERLYLVRRVAAWNTSATKRLIKSPKIHLIDSGLTATLSELKAEDWYNNRLRMGHLLESFVVQQLIAQAAWTDPDLRIWHYRDKDRVEVDAVITQGRKSWGFKVKAASRLIAKDSSALSQFADRCGGNFKQGILFYDGQDILPLADRRLLAVPLKELWER